MAPDTMTRPTTNRPTTTARTVGTVGLWTTTLLVLGNLLHPFDGSTALYADITAFAGKAEGALWIGVHLGVAVLMLVVPWLVQAWASASDVTRTRLVGRLAFATSLVGTAIGTIHLAGVDGAALGSFADLLDPADPVTATAGAVLLRLHLATFLSWVLAFWMATQALLGVAVILDGRRRWLGGLLLIGSALAAGSVIVTAVEGQLTTLSEPLLFRTSTLPFTVWLFAASMDLRDHGRTGRPEPELAP